MAELNPYAKFLDGRNPLDAMRAFPAKLTHVADRIGESGMQRSLAPGKWTVAQILCHLADCEIGFGWRLRQCMAEEGHVTQPFDQDKWAWPYGKLDARAALRCFVALREWNARFAAEVAPKDWERPFTHPERGEMTFRTIVETMAGHDENHYRQLELIANTR